MARFDRARDLAAGHLGHPEVGEHEIDRQPGIEPSQRIPPAGRLDHLMAILGEQFAQGPPNLGFVVDHENAQRDRWIGSRGPRRVLDPGAGGKRERHGGAPPLGAVDCQIAAVAADDPVVHTHVTLAPRGHLSHGLPTGHSAFAYVYDGRARFGPLEDSTEVAAGQLAVLGDGELVNVATGDGPARFLLLAARPLREPIARYGPFVMNTREEILQAVQDYQRGTLLG